MGTEKSTPGFGMPQDETLSGRPAGREDRACCWIAT